MPYLTNHSCTVSEHIHRSLWEMNRLEPLPGLVKVMPVISSLENHNVMKRVLHPALLLDTGAVMHAVRWTYDEIVSLV